MANVIQFWEVNAYTYDMETLTKNIKGGAVLGRTTQEKDVGVRFSAGMKV